jgi:hypothetical protein
MRQDLHDAIEAVNDDTENALGKSLSFTTNTRKLKLLAKDNTVLSEVVIPGGGSGGGSVDSVNGLFPDENGNVEVNLDDINDVDITSAADGQILKYDATSGKWVNGSGGGGTSDYTDLTNKPQVNGVTLVGNKTSADLGISRGSNENLLLNPWFNVNTTGFSSGSGTSITNKQIIDEWKCNAISPSTNALALSSGVLTFTLASGSGTSYIEMIQYFKNALRNGTYTLSFMLSDGNVYSGSFTFSGSSVTKRINFSGNAYCSTTIYTDYIIPVFATPSGTSSTISVKAVKLELGSASTLALDIAPNENLEMVKCNGVMRSNRNLLDNPWFTVNQRGFTSIISANNNDTTLFDRWKNANGGDTQNSTISLGSSGLTLTQDTTTNPWQICLDQIMEENVIANKVITFSVLLADGTLIKSSGLFNADIINEYDISTNLKLLYGMWTYNGKVRARIGIRTPQSYSQSASVTIRAVKLELGTESTLALDVAPNYTEELLKCQRFYVPLPRYWNGLTAGINSTYHLVNIALPTKMRAVPTISGSANIEGALNGASVMETIATSSMTVRNADSQFIQIEVQSSSQFDKNGNVLFMPSSGAALSAEL